MPKKLNDYIELTEETSVLTEETSVDSGVTLYRIKCIKTFTLFDDTEIKEGTLGGWVDSNSTVEYSWVDSNSWVIGSTVRNSVVRNSVVRNSVVRNSVVRNKTVEYSRAYENSMSKKSLVQNGSMENKTKIQINHIICFRDYTTIHIMKSEEDNTMINLNPLIDVKIRCSTLSLKVCTAFLNNPGKSYYMSVTYEADNKGKLNPVLEKLEEIN